MSVYLAVLILRRVIRHRIWAVNVEDILYWIFVAVYTFVQIHYTSDGKIRVYFVLGVVFGAWFMRISTRIVGTMGRKIYVFIKRNSE